jgi:DNA-binding LytR/AlgR family response regulator
MPRILIAEDEQLLRAELRDELSRLWPQAELVAEVGDGHAALQAIEQHAPEVLFLDVQMPGLSGIDVARLAAPRAHVVFITAYDQYAVRAFDEGALDYLVKPVEPARLMRAVQRVKERLGQAPADLRGLLAAWPAGAVVPAGPATSAPAPSASATAPLKWITVQRGRELHLITVDDVCYFQADSKYVAVVTAEASSLISMTLKELAARLDPECFWQVHRSTIVNVQSVKAVSRALTGKLTISLKSRPETLQVSPAYAHRFRQL